jgi:hypothetical protein
VDLATVYEMNEEMAKVENGCYHVFPLVYSSEKPVAQVACDSRGFMLEWMHAINQAITAKDHK